MDSFELLERAERLKATAENLLAESRLVERLAPLGRVEIIGSVRLGLVYRLDIDLLVIADEVSRVRAVEAASKLLDDGYFQTVELMDYQKFPEYDFPQGFYFGLRVPVEGDYWKLDIWYLRPGEAYTHLVMNALSRFEAALAENPHKAGIILEIKQAFFDGVKYRDGVKSIDIYRAVLDKDITSVAEFEAYFKK
jgi:hypothetical protein